MFICASLIIVEKDFVKNASIKLWNLYVKVLVLLLVLCVVIPTASAAIVKDKTTEHCSKIQIDRKQCSPKRECDGLEKITVKKIQSCPTVAFAPLKHATQYGVSLSRTCENLLISNSKTDCPTYDQILQIAKDNTNKSTAGKFIKIDGITQRGGASVPYPWKEYWVLNQTVIWVDPPTNVKPHLVMITIENNLSPYQKDVNQTRILNDYNVTWEKDRSIDANCSGAKITAKNWIYLFGDTLNYLKHGCDAKYTKFNGSVTTTFEKSFQDITTTQKYKDDKWIKEMKERCKVKGCP